MINSKQLSLYIPDLTNTETPTKKTSTEKKREKTGSNAEPIKPIVKSSEWKRSLKKNITEVFWDVFRYIVKIFILFCVGIIVILVILFIMGWFFELDVKLLVRLLLAKYIQGNFKMNIDDIILK